MVIPGIVALIYRDGAGRAFSQTFVTANWPFLWLPTRNSRHELKAKGFLIVVLFWCWKRCIAVYF